MTANKPKLTSISFVCENFDQVKIPIQAIQKLQIDNVHTEQTYRFERYSKNYEPNYTNNVEKYCDTFYLEYSIDTADKLTAKEPLFAGSGTRLVTYPDAVDMLLNFDDQSQEQINLPYYSNFYNENEWQKNSSSLKKTKLSKHMLNARGRLDDDFNPDEFIKNQPFEGEHIGSVFVTKHNLKEDILNERDN